MHRPQALSTPSYPHPVTPIDRLTGKGEKPSFWPCDLDLCLATLNSELNRWLLIGTLPVKLVHCGFSSSKVIAQIYFDIWPWLVTLTLTFDLGKVTQLKQCPKVPPYQVSLLYGQQFRNGDFLHFSDGWCDLNFWNFAKPVTYVL